MDIDRAIGLLRKRLLVLQTLPPDRESQEFDDWLNFEAGAISRHVESGHVSLILIDLKPIDLIGPLSQFQMTSLRFEDIIRLAHSVDSACGHPIGEARVANAVDVWRQI